MGFGGHRSYLLRRRVPKDLSPFYFLQPQSGRLYPEMATIISHPVSTVLGNLFSHRFKDWPCDLFWSVEPLANTAQPETWKSVSFWSCPLWLLLGALSLAPCDWAWADLLDDERHLEWAVRHRSESVLASYQQGPARLAQASTTQLTHKHELVGGIVLSD